MIIKTKLKPIPKRDDAKGMSNHPLETKFHRLKLNIPDRTAIRNSRSLITIYLGLNYIIMDGNAQEICIHITKEDVIRILLIKLIFVFIIIYESLVKNKRRRAKTRVIRFIKN